jgi:hypothetical protein
MEWSKIQFHELCRLVFAAMAANEQSVVYEGAFGFRDMATG